MQVFCMIFFRLWIWAAKGSATSTRKSPKIQKKIQTITCLK